MTVLRVAYVPEHFSTPLFLAEKQGYYSSKGLEIKFVPVIEGTGRLINLLNNNEVDIAIGLTEGFVADVGKGNQSYKIVGTYVKSPLCWAISTGYNRNDINKPEDLAGKRIGVSRIGSGSYIMSFVLGLKLHMLEPFFGGFPVCSNFKNLRDSVNGTIGDKTKVSDAFMWEHFTSKKYYDNHEIKRIGEIYTPWPSWVVTVRSEIYENHLSTIASFLDSTREGIAYFQGHTDEAVDHVTSNLDYSEADAREWLKTVVFNAQIGAAPIDKETVVDATCRTLKAAKVLEDTEIPDKLLAEGVILSL